LFQNVKLMLARVDYTVLFTLSLNTLSLNK